MRLDVSVNLLTMQALEKGVITVLGGSQTRPNIHIDDVTDLYLFLENKNVTGIYNAGFENLRIIDIAKMISDKTGAEIKLKNRRIRDLTALIRTNCWPWVLYQKNQ